MALIPMEDLQTLQSAATVKATAQTAEADQQEKSIAYTINTAANCGQTEVTYNGRLLETVKTNLENEGYTLTYDIAKMNDQDIVHISWAK